ncbi:hypothetical protein AYO21_09124 [Fonsecaea monophora]|uniref:Uncharacterized protein n=1 Tax=Fonsecaea monophora TaxID=254056 RepID=A0A177F0B3_9EURO|nr:hypothetical protein AYO21_09124 [Fonsecaea monophora]OAG36649.1 hypothetical protein AYO21_09124 [Fonsecaea monophora]
MEASEHAYEDDLTDKKDSLVYFNDIHAVYGFLDENSVRRLIATRWYDNALGSQIAICLRSAAHYAPSAVYELHRAGVLDDVKAQGIHPFAVCWRRPGDTFIACIRSRFDIEFPMVCLPLDQLDVLLLHIFWLNQIPNEAQKSPNLFGYGLESCHGQGRCNRPQSQGQSGLAQHDWPSTIDYYTKAIEKYDADPSFHCNRAEANIKLEAYGYAIADATKAIELDMSVMWVFVTQSLGALGSVGTQQTKNVYGAGKVFTTVSTPKVPLVETYTPGIVDKIIDYFQERLGLITAITQAVLTVSSNYDHLCIQRKEAGMPIDSFADHQGNLFPQLARPPSWRICTICVPFSKRSSWLFSDDITRHRSSSLHNNAMTHSITRHIPSRDTHSITTYNTFHPDP